jgi:hypothetical protein
MDYPYSSPRRGLALPMRLSQVPPTIFVARPKKTCGVTAWSAQYRIFIRYSPGIQVRFSAPIYHQLYWSATTGLPITHAVTLSRRPTNDAHIGANQPIVINFGLTALNSLSTNRRLTA